MDTLVRGKGKKADMRIKKKNSKADSVENQTISSLPITPVNTCYDRFAYGAEHELFEQALSRVFARDAESLEKSAALLTACCMISKISFEKIFKHLKKVCKTSSKRLKPEKNSKKKINERKQKKLKKKVSKSSLKLENEKTNIAEEIKERDVQASGKVVL